MIPGSQTCSGYQVIPDSNEVDAAVHITLTHSQQPSALDKGDGVLLQPTALEVQVLFSYLLKRHVKLSGCRAFL